jgi:subtilase family serine protease
VVDRNRVSIVTNSWGDVESNTSQDSIKAYEAVFLQGAMQGMSFMFSSGDDGDELANTGLRQADYPTSDPYVTSVGGTADAIGQGGARLFQTGWGTDTYSLSSDGKSWTGGDYLYGAGGGVSALFNRPSYQDGVVPNTYGRGRAVPDVGPRRRPACSSVRRRPSRTASTTTSTASAAPAWPPRCSPA